MVLLKYTLILVVLTMIFLSTDFTDFTDFCYARLGGETGGGEGYLGNRGGL